MLKKLTKSLIILILSMLIIEIGTAYFHFQKSWEKGSSTKWFVSRMFHKYIEDSNGDLNATRILSANEYKALFGQLNFEINQLGGQLKILYIPRITLNSERNLFFKELAKDNEVELIDLSNKFSKHSAESLYNTPTDFHPSRFAHILIADHLYSEIQHWNVDTTKQYMSTKIRGPFANNVDTVSRYNGLAYRSETNKNGFRMNQEIEEKKINIIVLGDSFTFGTGVNTPHTYPNILNRKMVSHNILNLGIPGTSLLEQYEEWKQVKSHLSVPLIVIQVLDNDVMN